MVPIDSTAKPVYVVVLAISFVTAQWDVMPRAEIERKHADCLEVYACSKWSPLLPTTGTSEFPVLC